MFENLHSFKICFELSRTKRSMAAQANFVKFNLMQQSLFSFGLHKLINNAVEYTFLI